MGRINSRMKGKRGELAAVKAWKHDGGYQNTYRTNQFCGKAGDSDIVVPELNFHIEVKVVERLNIDDALAQAERDRLPGQTPLVMHKKNGTEWRITMSFTDWLEVLHGEYPDNETIEEPPKNDNTDSI